MQTVETPTLPSSLEPPPDELEPMGTAQTPTLPRPPVPPPAEPEPMATAKKILTLIITAVPFVGFPVAIVLLWTDFAGWTNLPNMPAPYVAPCLGNPAGYHRLLTHRS